MKEVITRDIGVL